MQAPSAVLLQEEGRLLPNDARDYSRKAALEISDEALEP